jgi:hypothetical protein
VFEKFGIEQVWQQLVHFTEPLNRKILAKLDQLTKDEYFIQRLTDLYEEAKEV